ncbi:hypothetical protein CSUI_009136 [Cystoisospora suis]|uniref:Uncharacterized protein n=1 Tax=Cystoisospora suis TaxID=483139 RepID=A0A2C6KL01_9APIC|nr:hypothetical protein CSUI_009136 [Cystoisospora suis]
MKSHRFFYHHRLGVCKNAKTVVVWVGRSGGVIPDGVSLWGHLPGLRRSRLTSSRSLNLSPLYPPLCSCPLLSSADLSCRTQAVVGFSRSPSAGSLFLLSLPRRLPMISPSSVAFFFLSFSSTASSLSKCS